MKIFYRFRASPESHPVLFDSNHVSVFDLKERIMVERKFGKGTDFHLRVYNEEPEINESNEMNDGVELHDTQMVRVRRIPANVPGTGSAFQYVKQ